MSKADAQPVQNAAGWVLEAILSVESPMSKALRERFGHPTLWKYKTGRETPKVPTAVEIRDLTGGSITLEAWAVPAKRKDVPEPATSEWSRAYLDIEAERAHQVEKGRTAERDDARPPEGWLACLDLVLRKGHEVRLLWVKVGSVAVAAIESIDRLAARAKSG